MSASQNHQPYAKMTEKLCSKFSPLHEWRNELAVCCTINSFIIARVTLCHPWKTFRSLLILINCRLPIPNVNYVFQWLNSKVILPALLQFYPRKNAQEMSLFFSKITENTSESQINIFNFVVTLNKLLPSRYLPAQS